MITPHSGHSKVYLRAHKFNSFTIATNITDIYNFIDESDTICNTDETCQNHYNTFIQEASVEKKTFGEDGQPLVLRKDLGSCEHCKSYGFTSKTEKQRHLAISHRRQAQNLKSRLFNTIYYYFILFI